MDDDYIRMQRIIANMQVVNDPAERGILLTKALQDKLSKKPEERMKLFLAVPHIREKLAKLTKDEVLTFSMNKS